MSMRPPVDRQRIIRFLQQLGQQFRKPGRVYLVGGTTLVFEGFRTQTLDIDLAFEVGDRDHGEFIRAVRSLKDELAINVEEASPGDSSLCPKATKAAPSSSTALAASTSITSMSTALH